jgi:hypothetical protein
MMTGPNINDNDNDKDDNDKDDNDKDDPSHPLIRRIYLLTGPSFLPASLGSIFCGPPQSGI